MLSVLGCFSQNDSVKFTRDILLEEGVYLNYLDFRTNRPIPKQVIKSKESKDQLDFLDKTVDNNDFIIFVFGGTQHAVPTDSIWGYCQNNTIYINYKKGFCRVPVFGHISHFIATVEIYNSAANNPYYGNYGTTVTGMPMKTKEVRQFMLDFYTGNVVEYTLDNFSLMLSGDKALYDEFKLLKKRKQRQMMGLYLRKYNEAHPIFYPKN
jgi:hypothetical protein